MSDPWLTINGLGEDGPEVLSPASRDALDRARDFVPNLIIMDIQLPNISGLDLIEQAKSDRTLRAIPVLAVTAAAYSRG